MGCSVSNEKAKYIWGKNFIKNLDKKLENEKADEVAISKIAIAKRNLKYLQIGKWVKFIGISGSVAAGFAKEEDDIDLFIVVRNGCGWIYRGLIALRNIFHRTIRVKRDRGDVSDKLCINFICEERSLRLENDMFNFHELMYLVPIYNDKYLNYIYSQNEWLKTEYGVKNDLLISRIQSQRFVNFVFRILNWLAFFVQLLFMVVFKHSPNVKRLEQDFKVGRIEFFEEDYKKKRMESYLK